MGKIFYISDLHFSHFNAIKFDNRPWTNIEEMNEAIIKEWNERVTDGDEVYILGDICWSSPYDARCLISRLKGKKHWVTGNHDCKMMTNEELCRQFASVHEGYHKIYDGGKAVILSHYPIFMFDGVMKGNIHLYGHIHNNKLDCEFVKKWRAEYEQVMTEQFGKDFKVNMFNVGLMVPYMNWGPRTLNEILEANK